MKKYKSLIFLVLFIIYMESIYKITNFNSLFSLDILAILFFSIAYALFLFIISRIFNDMLNKVIYFIFIISITIIFISQLVYYKVYSSVFSFYSMTKADQAFEFMDTIIKVMLRNIIPIILMILPLILLLIFNKRIIFYKISFKKIIIFFVVSILVFLSSILLINSTKDNKGYTQYKLYYEINSPILSANKLGLITTMRLDLKRLMFGFKEKITLTENIDVSNQNKEEVVTYNTMDIDFDTLIENESNEEIKNIYTYFKNATPTNKNDYTGIFEGKNLIYILAESFNSIAIDKDLTPTLYKLYNEGFKFNNYYTPLFPVSTADGEYMALTSLLPMEASSWSIYYSRNKYFPFVLGNEFKSLDYTTNSYHDHLYTYYDRYLTHKNFGYNFKACGMGLDINCNVWPESDLEMVNATIDDYIDSTPFHTYYVTVSGHLRYNLNNYITRKNWNYVKDLGYSDVIKAFLACNLELDKALEKILEELEEKGILDDTVIAITPDHYPYGLTVDEMNELSNTTITEPFDKHKTAFIIWNNKTESNTVDKYTTNLDVLPTLLNLFGLEYDSRLLIGKDAFSNSSGLVTFSDRSFITNYGIYNSLNSTFTPFNGKTIDDNYVEDMNNYINQRFYLSKRILELDLYRKIFNK